MPKPRRKRFSNRVASEVIAAIASGEMSVIADGKNPFAVALGRLGGLKGGPARAAKLTAKQLSASGKKAAKARWRISDRRKRVG